MNKRSVRRLSRNVHGFFAVLGAVYIAWLIVSLITGIPGPFGINR